MGTIGGPNTTTDGLVFGFDTGYPLVGSGNDTTYRFNKGAPIFNIARELTSWPTRARATVYLYTGSIQPPIPGEAIYKLVCNADNAGILIRDGGYYYAGGNWGSGTVQNTNILSDGTNQYTPLGNNKFVYSLYVRPTENTLDTTYTSIDIGDKNSVNVQNVDDLTDWHKLETTDAVQINSTTYPYDFYDIAYGPNTIGNEILISAVQILRTPGMDSGSLKTPSPGTQHLTYGADRSFSGSLIDLTRTTDIDLSLISFDSNAQITFDGTDDYFTTTGLSIGTPSSVSFETVIRFDGTLDSNDRKVFHWDKTSTTNGVAQIRKGNANGRLMYQHHDGSQWYTLSVDDVVTSDTYIHILVVHSSTTATMYKDGVQVGTATVGNLEYTNAGEILVGYRANSEYWKGDIPIFKVYNRALAAEEVKENYNAIKSRFGLT